MKIYIGLLAILFMMGGDSLHGQVNNYKINESIIGNSDSVYFAFDDADQRKGFPRRSIKKKDPEVAMLLAIVPGCLFHGAGHLYLGKKQEAAMLFSAEVLGLCTMYASFAGGWSNNHKIRERAYIGMKIGGIIFLGSWVYDIIAAPILCYRMNKRAWKASLHPFIRKNQIGEREMGVQLSCRF